MTKEFSSMKIYPSGLNSQLEQALRQMAEYQVLNRLWQHDYTLWAKEPTEITNRLDWLDLPESMVPRREEIEQLVAEVRAENFDTALLMGMGGSSLAPEVFRKISGVRQGYLDLRILDSTNPGTVMHYQNEIDLGKTLFIVSTKSGGTVETLSFTKYFYNLTVAALGSENAGDHFIAITDPGSKLDQMASDLNFRKAFLNNPNLGGRYSALSFFGLVPAALIGMDIGKLLAYGRSAADQNNAQTPPENSPGAVLGALLGSAAQNGRDKLTFLSNAHISPFSDWIEQLIAESTGKSGKGILPVVGESLPYSLDSYGDDRIFVIQQFSSFEDFNQVSRDLQSLGHPVIEYRIQEAAELGYWMFTWEVATANVGHLLEIHPFNQPNVEAAKILARKSVSTYEETGQLPERDLQSLEFEVIDNILASANPGDYVALQAYVEPTPENEDVFRQLQAAIRDRYELATTFGFGPRFLHSTGQLHKGDRGNGIFLQFVSTNPNDLQIPENPGTNESFISFGVLKHAQALGDADALEEAGRRILAFELDAPILADIQSLVERMER